MWAFIVKIVQCWILLLLQQNFAVSFYKTPSSSRISEMFKCGHPKCILRNTLQDIQQFRPRGGEGRAKAQKLFDEAVQQCAENWDVDLLDKVRCKQCIRCRNFKVNTNNNPNTKIGKCRFFYQKMRQESICEVCSSTENIEFDHIDSSTKIHRLGDYTWWAYNGGVDAMKKEFTKCRSLCRKCHDKRTQVQQTQKRKYEHADDMPTGTRNERSSKKHRQYTDEKAAYIFGIKMQIGVCEHCHLPFDPQCSRSFHFARKNAAEKLYNIANLQGNNTSLKSAKPTIDNEIAKCWLLCCDCHKKITSI